MSLLRFTRPGKAIEASDFIDLGPETGRTTHTRGAIRGGAIVAVAKAHDNRDRTNERVYRIANQDEINRKRRESRARVKARKA
jgi:hypothetical protein